MQSRFWHLAKYDIRYIVAALMLAITIGSSAETLTKSEADTLYKKYLVLYSKHDQPQLFYKYSEQLKTHYLKQKKLTEYYKLYMNEALFEAECNNTYQAIQAVNNLLEDMKAHNFGHYSLVSQALGTIFEMRGNYHMAEYHYRKGIDETDPTNESEMVSSHLRLASLLKFQKPTEAKRLIEKCAEPSKQFMPYHQIYLYIKAITSFALNDEKDFRTSYENYSNYCNTQEGIGEYGKMALEAIDLFYNGKNEEAWHLVEQNDVDLDALSRQDMLIIMMKQKGDYKAALMTAKHRMELVDSLNSDMLFDNMNQINAEAGLAKAQRKEAKMRERMLLITLILTVAIIAILMTWGYRRRKMRHELEIKNQQLTSALQMAEESDRIKSEFLKTVTHEIRTPLNTITGFNQILNTPKYTLTEEQRQNYVSRININVQAITRIIDELLDMAEKNTADYYIRTDKILCNRFFSEIIYKYRDQVPPSIELRYTTDVINRFTINTNADYVKQIADHLINNSIKCTSRGSIELNCHHEGQMLLVSITDTGKGIPSEMQDKVFQQFTKIDQFQQGIGLGLAVSQKIARKLGGSLVLDKSYKNGARFVLSLPCEG